MNIAFIGTKGIPYQNTRDRQEYALESIAVNLATKNHSVFVFSDPQYSSVLEYKGVTIIPSKKSILSIIHKLQKIKNLDIIHIMSIEYAWLAFWVSIMMPHIRIVFEYHNYTFVDTPHNRQKYRLLSYISAQFSDSLITNNTPLYRLFNQSFHHKLYSIETGVEHTSHQSSPALLSDMFPEQYLLVNISLYKDSKSLDLWLKAYQKHSVNIPVVIMGKVHPHIREHYQSSNIIYVGEISGTTEKLLIQNAYAFIEISQAREDIYPLSLALINGVPVLAAQGMVNEALIRNAGRIFTPYNYSSIMTSLSTIQDMYPILKRKAMAYIPEIQDRLSLDGQIHKYIFVYVNTFQKKFRQAPQETQSTYSIPVIARS
jgi:hypothetical protein